MMFDPRTPQVWVGEVGFVTSFLNEAEFFPAQTNAFVLPAPFFQFLGMKHWMLRARNVSMPTP